MCYGVERVGCLETHETSRLSLGSFELVLQGVDFVVRPKYGHIRPQVELSIPQGGARYYVAGFCPASLCWSSVSSYTVLWSSDTCLSGLSAKLWRSHLDGPPR